MKEHLRNDGTRGMVAWPDEADLAPDTLYKEICRTGVCRTPTIRLLPV